MLKLVHTNPLWKKKSVHSEPLNRKWNIIQVHLSTWKKNRIVCLTQTKSWLSAYLSKSYESPWKPYWLVRNSFTEPQLLVKDSLLGPQRMSGGSFFIQTAIASTVLSSVTMSFFSQQLWHLRENTSDCWNTYVDWRLDLSMALVLTMEIIHVQNYYSFSSKIDLAQKDVPMKL